MQSDYFTTSNIMYQLTIYQNYSDDQYSMPPQRLLLQCLQLQRNIHGEAPLFY